MKYARIVNSAAVDTRTDSPEGCFHPDIAAQFVEVPDQVEDGWTVEGSVWSAPVIPEPVPAPPVVVVPPKVSAIEFKMLFTSPERIAAKTARATDMILDDFWGLLDDPRTQNVDMALASVQQAIEYTLTVAGVADVAARKAEILTGVVK